MKLDSKLLYTKVLDMDGDVTDHNGEDLTVRKAIRFALISGLVGESLSGPEKKKNFNLARKINNIKDNTEESVELKAEEITKIKDRVGRVWGAEVVGFIYPLLDPAEKVEDAMDNG